MPQRQKRSANTCYFRPAEWKPSGVWPGTFYGYHSLGGSPCKHLKVALVLGNEQIETTCDSSFAHTGLHNQPVTSIYSCPQNPFRIVKLICAHCPTGVLLLLFWLHRQLNEGSRSRSHQTSELASTAADTGLAMGPKREVQEATKAAQCFREI